MGGTQENNKMANLTNAVAAFVLLSVLITLTLNMYDDFQVGYNFTAGDVHTGNFTGSVVTGNIVEQLNAITFRQGVEQITDGVNNLKPGSASGFDILGGLASVGIGALKTVTGLLIFPYQIINIVVTFYAGAVPGAIMGLLAMITVYVGFILLAAYIRREQL